MNHIIERALRGRKVLLGRDFYQSRQVDCPRLTFGNRYAAWTFCPLPLGEHAVVYSFGVGEDISFDLALIERYQLHIHAFDPSPRSIDWVQKQDPGEKFHFYPFGLAAQDGQVSFNEPADPGIHSLQIGDSDNDSQAGLKTHMLPVHRLPGILQKLGHRRLDLLKMDIEGAEYDVIDDIIHSEVPISQILIEFHHRFDTIGIDMTRQAIARLNEAGYKIFHVSPSGEEISFIKNGTLDEDPADR